MDSNGAYPAVPGSGASVASTITNDAWGGPMGGSPADGLPSGGNPMMQQQPNMMMQQQQYGGNMIQQPQMNQQQQGSVTRFAPPSPQQPQQQQQTSYASRSQQMYTAGPTSSPAPANSFLARSQQAYSNNTNGVPETFQTQVPSANYSAAGQFQQQNQPQPQMNSYAAAQPPKPQPPQQSYSSSSITTAGSMQQQPQPSHYSATASPQPVAAGSYTARSQSYNSPQRNPVPPTPQTTPYGNQSVVSVPYSQQQQYPNAPYGQSQQSGPPRATPPVVGLESTQHQQRLLQDSTRKIQEHAYYMKQAMEQQDLRVVLDRACHMLGELGGPPHGQQVTPNTGNAALLTPKMYYELYMRALEDMPALEAYFMQDPSRMRELYTYCQYAPRVVSRLYLQIAAGAALVRTGACGAHWVLHELQQAVKCEQNPVRGLFVRNFLLTALRDSLPDTPAPVQDESERGHDDDDSAATANEEDTIVEENAQGTVKESYEFILSNFMEMNKLWVRIQHLPGEGRNKDVRKRRERERNDLRLLIGSNLMRLSQLENVTSKLYGERILPQILDHIVVAGDPLSQAYVMDCMVQVFPDEYHIETLPVLLNVCPRLRDKVNIRTILQGLMDRLANYLMEEELLLDENDTNQVKRELARDSFGMFQTCVQRVYNARGPKLTAKEVIRLQTALLQFSVRNKNDSMAEIRGCIDTCVTALRQANASYEITAQGTVAASANAMRPLDPVAVAELEKMLSIPIGRTLELENYSVLIGFLPWENRRQVAISLLEAGTTTSNAAETDQLFHMIAPLLNGDDHGGLVSKLLHQLDHPSTDTLFSMLSVARKHMEQQPLTALVYASLQLVRRMIKEETQPEEPLVEEKVAPEATPPEEETNGDEVHPAEETPADEAPTEEAPPENGEESTGVKETDTSPEEATNEQPVEAANDSAEAATSEAEEPALFSEDPLPENVLPQPTQMEVTPRIVFAFVQETIVSISKTARGKAFLLMLESALAADGCAQISDEKEVEYSPVALEFFHQALALYEEQMPESTDPMTQFRNIGSIANALVGMKSLDSDNYERIVTKTAQFAARVTRKPEQCRLVALCARLFFPVGNTHVSYKNPQRALECLQRCLKLADACTSVNPAHVSLFVELLEDYIFFFENENTLVTASYISGLVALIKEHLNNPNSLGSTRDAKAHLAETLDYIRGKKVDPSSAALFGQVQVE